jgi:dynein heavy chain
MSTGDVLRPVCRQIAKAFDLPIFQVEGHLAQEPSASAIAAFLKPDGPAKLLIYMGSGKGFADEEGEMYEDDEVRVFVATGEADIFARRGVLLLKSSEAVAIDSPAALDAHVSCTVVLGSPVKSLLATLEHAFQPVLSSAVGTWGAQLADSGEELFSGVGKYVGMLADAVHTVEGGIELARPSMRNTEAVELKPPAFARIAQNPEVIESYEGAVAAWCVTVEELLTAVPGAAVLVPEGDEGPSTELEYWKGRMQRFASVSEQLRSRENRVVLGVLGCTRSAVLRRWKAIEPTMSEAANEARDNTKYLQTFEKFFETLTSGTPLQIVDCFPSIFSNVKMM